MDAVQSHAEANPRLVQSINSRVAAGKDVDGREAVAYLTGLQLGDDFAFADDAAEVAFRKMGITVNPTTGDHLIPAARFGEFAALFAKYAGSRAYAPHVVVGDTFPHKDALRRAGGVWDSRRKVWLVPAGAELPAGLTAKPRAAN